MAVLEAYFDESERSNGLLCVAAYVFTQKRARSFADQWPSIFGGRTFHMTDLAHRRGEFSDISDADRDRMIRDAVSLVAKKFTLGRAVSCNVNEADRILPRTIRGFNHVYSILCSICARSVGHWVNENCSPRDSVAYIFEAGHAHQGEASEWINEAREEDVTGEQYRYRSHAFVPKSDSVLLQAADLLAWEYAKYLDETYLRNIRNPRGSIAALVNSRPQRYDARHYDEAGLRDIAEKIKSVARPT